jgi:hypothetical protein
VTYDWPVYGENGLISEWRSVDEEQLVQWLRVLPDRHREQILVERARVFDEDERRRLLKLAKARN